MTKKILSIFRESRFFADLPQQTQPQRRQGKSLAEIVKKDFRMTPEIRVPQEKSPQPKGKPPVFRYART